MTPRDHPPNGGTYRIVGDRILFYWPQFGYDTTFTFRRTRDGSLVLTGVKPIDAGDGGSGQAVLAPDRTADWPIP